MAKYSLSEQSAARLRKSVQYTELVGADHRQPTAPSGVIPVGGGGQGQLVEIVSNDGAGKHAWKYLKWNGTAWSQNLRGDADDGKAIGIRGENFPAGTRGLVLPWTIEGGGTLLVFLPIAISLTVPLTLVSNATRGGVYNVTELTPPTTDVPVGSGTFSAGDLGGTGGSALLYNLAEIGQTSHDLTSASPAIVLVTATLWYVNSDGTKIFVAYIVAPGCEAGA